MSLIIVIKLPTKILGWSKLDKGHSLLLRFWSNFSYGFCGMENNIVEFVYNVTIDMIENRVVFVVLAVILFGYNLGCSETVSR